MTIGIPKEIMQGERRVAAVPETVTKLVADGHAVLVEQSAGAGSFFSDDQFVAAGAEIVNCVEELFNRVELIMKVKEPQFNNTAGKHEVDMMHAGQYLVTFIHPASPSNHDMVKNMAAKGVISITLDGVPRITRAQSMDALTSMSTCAGYKSVLMAFNELAKFAPMIGSAVGMIKPANVLVVGAGVSGLQAISTAKRMGAVVHACDIRPEAAEQAKSLGAKLIDLSVPAEIAVGEGGYARSLPEDMLAKERAILAEAVKTADVVVLTALVPSKIAPILVTEEMVKSMQDGSVIVDLSIDQGGNCEISPPGTIEVKHGVTIYGIKNMPGLMPVSSTWMFSQNSYNLVKYLMKDGKIVLDMDDEIVAETLTTYDGKVVHAGTLEAMGI